MFVAMTKVKKNKKHKSCRYSVNRKRMNRRKLPKSQSEIVKKVWQNSLSCKQNLSNMGLIYDVNKEINASKTLKSNLKIGGAPNTKIVDELKKEATILRVKQYKLPKNQVEYLIYLLKKYGEDYKAMAKDKKNVIQATWKQLRAKIKIFKSIPQQYKEYLESLKC